MSGPLSRRRFVAAVIPGLLAGCLVESEEGAAGSADSENDSEADTEDSVADTEDSEATDDGADDDSTENDETGSQRTDDALPDEIGPDGSGLVVANVDVFRVTDGGYETTVDARLTVENAGRFSYGIVEFRVDAYATRPNSPDRDAVGHTYVVRRFSSGDRFTDGTRRFDVSVSFRSRESRARADPDWYEVDVAVRRAEPV